MPVSVAASEKLLFYCDRKSKSLPVSDARSEWILVNFMKYYEVGRVTSVVQIERILDMMEHMLSWDLYYVCL